MQCIQEILDMHMVYYVWINSYSTAKVQGLNAFIFAKGLVVAILMRDYYIHPGHS